MSTTPSTDVATQASALPELAATPAALGNIDGSDIALPRLYKGEYQSGHVQEELVKAGSIFLAAGKDDTHPVTIVKDGTKEGEKGVLIHVLNVFKNLSLQDENNELQRWDFGDPSAPADAKVGFNYVVCLPEIEDGDSVPVKLLLNKTSKSTGDRINFHLLKHSGPPHELAFRLTLKKRERESSGQKQRWFVWVEDLVEATPENVETAAKLAVMVAGTNVSTSAPDRSTGVEPAI
jgi:hypothetical protein